jgi:serine/threonine protein kinase
MRGQRAEADGEQPAWNPDAGAPAQDSTVSHYRILGLLGRGGMGVVYRALDGQSGQEVALKLLASDRVHGEGDRFRREARAAASLDHPNIAKVLEIGDHQGHLFLAMPLYEGETLKKRLDRAEEVEPMPLAEIISVAAQLASALETAHTAGIVHRDLKPANLMLTRGGRLKLLDFGLALWEGSSRLTDAGRAVGTLAYMAPEQLRGEEVDARADLWSFGVVLYEMLAGRPPFVRNPHDSLQDQMLAILNNDPPPLRETRPDTPDVLARIVDRCLRKDPRERYATAGEIVDDLRSASVLTEPHPQPDRETEGLRLWLVLAAGILLVFIFAVFHRLTQKSPGPLQVRVREPEIQGLPPTDTTRMASSLGQAMREGLRGIGGLAVAEGAQPAQEEITASAYCGPEVCLVVLHRLNAQDARELWSERLQVPVSQPADLAAQVAARLRRAYPAER